MIGNKRIFKIAKKEIHPTDYPRWNVDDVTVDHYVDIHKEICTIVFFYTVQQLFTLTTQSKLNEKKKFDENGGRFV
jgi:hypothetical protein